jgi:DNA modification methylase
MKIDNRGHDDYLISEKEEKSGHNWQQSESSVAQLIETFTKEGDFIIEPFAGSGTTLAVAHKLKRKVVGAELDMDSYNIAKARLKDVGL